MAGLAEVAAGQGSGLSWMGPESSFDPVQYAQVALEAGLQKKSLDEKKKNEQLKLTDYKPGEQFNIDLKSNTAEDIKGLQTYFQEKVKADPNYFNTYAGALELQQKTSELGLKDKRRVTQYTEYNDVKKKIDTDQGKDINTDKTYRNLAMYENPEDWVDDPSFSPYAESYTNIKETLAKDPYYKTNPNRLVHDAREEFRDQNKKGLLTPVRKTESLIKHIQTNQDVLVNTMTTEKEVGGVTRKDVKRNRDKTIITYTDGSTQEVEGTDQTATNDYNSDSDIKRSVDIYYSDLTEDEQKKYAGSQNPALDWYKDLVYTSTGDATASTTREKGNGANSYTFGNGTYKTDLNMNPFTSRRFTSRKGTTAGGTTSINGIEVKTKNGDELSLENITPEYFYLSDNATQNKIPAGSRNMTLKGATSFKAPTFNKDIVWDSFKNELATIPREFTYKGKKIKGTAWDEFNVKFGGHYKDVEGGNLGGIILTDDEVTFLEDLGMGDLIQDRKFTSGTLSYQKDNGDGSFSMQYQPGAILPLEYTESSINGLLGDGNDIGRAIDGYSPDRKYRYVQRTTEKNKDKKEDKKEKDPYEDIQTGD